MGRALGRVLGRVLWRLRRGAVAVLARGVLPVAGPVLARLVVAQRPGRADREVQVAQFENGLRVEAAGKLVLPGPQVEGDLVVRLVTVL